MRLASRTCSFVIDVASLSAVIACSNAGSPSAFFGNIGTIDGSRSAYGGFMGHLRQPHEEER